MKLSKSLLAVALSLAAFGAVAAVNLVRNGSFESGTSTALTGWDIKNNGTVAFSNFAYDRDRSIALDSAKVKGENFFNSSISQTIYGTGLVNLSFWYAANVTQPGATNEVKFEFVYALGKEKGSVLSGSNNSQQWQQYTGTFDLGTSGSAALSFSAAGRQDGIGGYIDKVSVTAVPEPETYAMLLAGLGLMGAIALRRNKGKSD